MLRVGAWAETTPPLSIAANVVVQELEDLVPVPIAIIAARNYAVKVAGVPREEADKFDEDHGTQRIQQESTSLFNALTGECSDCFGPDAHIEKSGFAKEIIAVLAAARGTEPAPEIKEFRQNFGLLLRHLARLLRQANQHEEERRLNNMLKRTIAEFLDDYPTPTTRERASLLIEKLQASVEDSPDGDRVSLQTAKLRREFDLDKNHNDPIEHYDEFCERVKALQYEERLSKQDAAGTLPELTGEVKAVGTAVAERA